MGLCAESARPCEEEYGGGYYRQIVPGVIQHVAENDGFEANASMGKNTWTSKMKKDGYLLGQ